MKNKNISSLPPGTKGKGVFRVLSVLLLLTLLFGILTPLAMAADDESWNGSSDITGGGGQVVTGHYNLEHADIGDMYGYRFTVLDASGNKPSGSRSIDIVFKADNSATYRTYGTDKRSHVELNMEYEDKGTVSLVSDNGDFYRVSFSASTDATASARDYGLYFYDNYFDTDKDLFEDPGNMEAWLIDGGRAGDIAKFCGLDDGADLTNHYIIVEPLYAATLERANAVYMMTLAEYAVFQAYAMQCWDYSNFPQYSNGEDYSALIRHLTALYGMHLYADGDFPMLGTTPIESSHIQDLSYAGAPGEHIIINSSGCFWGNSAENVLKYQMGMGIYTKIPQGVTTSDVTIRVWVQDIGGTANSYDEDNYTMDDSYDAGTISAGVYDEHDFVDDHGPGSMTGFSSYPVYIEVNGSQELQDISIPPGDVTVDLYYTRNRYTVTLNTSTGISAVTGAGTYYYEEDVTIDATLASGYSFKRWEGDPNTTTKKYTFEMPAKNVTGIATATANTYSNDLAHYLRDTAGNNLLLIGRDTFSVTFGNSYTMGADRARTAPKGFLLSNTFSRVGASGTYTLGASFTQGASRVRYVYSYDLQSYKISYVMGGGTNNANNPTSYTILDGITLQDPTPPAGYAFDGWYIGSSAFAGVAALDVTGYSDMTALYADLNARTTGDLTITAKWKPIPVGYKVNHYLMDVNGNYPSTPTATDSLSANTGASVTPAVKNYGTGITAPATQTVTVAADGSTVVNYYYARQKFHLDLNGWLDGALSGSLDGYGTADVYVNGSQVGNDVADYWAEHYYGSSYEIKDVKTATGKTYNGVYSGGLTGTIPASTHSVVLK